MKNEKLNLTELEKKFDFFLKLEHDVRNFIFPATLMNSAEKHLFLMVLFAIEHDASDIHITSSSRSCYVHVKAGDTMYCAKLALSAEQIKAKFVAMLGIPKGFDDKPAISNSFQIELEADWAKRLGLPIPQTDLFYQIAVRIQH